MVRKQAFFICSTPYQIIGAVSIAKAEKLEADILIIGVFDDYLALADQLRKTEVFSAVYTTGTLRRKAPGRKKGFVEMFLSEKTVKPFLPEDVTYDLFYTSSWALLKNIVQHVLLKRNPYMKVVMYEDGIGTYTVNSHALVPTKLMIKAQKLLGWNVSFKELVSKIEVYEPALYEAPSILASCPVCRMPRISDVKDNERLLQQLFQIQEEDLIRTSVIFFDTLRDFGIIAPEILDKIDVCIKIIIGELGKEQVTVKPHPRSITAINLDVNTYTRTGIPMEALFGSMDCLSETVLIAYASTALYTPRVLLGEEPYVISLHRLISGNDPSSNQEIIFQKFRSLYVQKEKMIAPEDIEELKDCVHLLSSKININRC